MKKIKITEQQAKLLGLSKISENEESGVKSVGVALGDVIVRMVISGEGVAKFKDRIMQLIARHDKDARVGFFDATGKIVGNVKEIKLDSIKRDIKALDPNILVEKKPLVKSLKEGVRNVVQISKDQYNRIFATKPLNESEVKGGLNRVDKTFKKEFAGKDVQNLAPSAPVDENEFKIDKPNPSLSKSAQGHFGSTMNEGDNQFKNEVKELIKFLYRKSEELSPFWEKQGIKYDDICNSLVSKGLIVAKNGKYEVSKKLGSPQAAVQAIEDQLTTLMPTQQGVEAEAYPAIDAPQTDAPQTDAPQTDAPQSDAPSLETENNYPTGASNDSSAPWNKKDQEMSKPNTAKEAKLVPVAFNREIEILKDPAGALYVFYHDGIDKKDFMEYASVPRNYVGKDEDGQPEYDYDFDSAEINAEVVAHYINDNLATLTKGEGLDAYEKGIQLVKIDEPLKKELMDVYSMDKNIAKVLGPIEEITEPEAMDSFKKNVAQAFTPAPTSKPKPTQHIVVAKLAELKAREAARREAEKKSGVEEMTGSASSGAFTAPMTEPIKREMPETPVVGETTTVASAGNFQYDTPGGLTMDLKSHGKTKAEKTPQWAGGSFVKQPSCSKMNNNKEAENGGCNQGASSLKTVKAKGSINAPSLGENEIYEAIANKTGKSIDEVKRIIDSKIKKA